MAWMLPLNWRNLSVLKVFKALKALALPHQIKQPDLHLFAAAIFLRRRFSVLLTGLVVVCASASSQTLSANTDLLGMRHEQLQGSLAGAEPVHAAHKLSSGAIGSLRVPDMLLQGMHFEQTFYFLHQKLTQMELVHVNPDPTAYTDLVQSLRVQLGPELASSVTTPDTVMETASWVKGDADVMLFLSGKPGHTGLRLVIRQRQLLDASEL